MNPPALLAHEKPQPTGHHHPAAAAGQKATSTPHHHKMVEIPANQPVPTVNLVVHPDLDQGWNLEIQAKHFTFAPNKLDGKGITTEGHAHLYVNGKKLTRLYGPWYYLSELPPGQHTVTVTLNTNGHEELMHNGKPIQASQVISVPTP